MPVGQFAELVHGSGAPGLDGGAGKIAANVRTKGLGALVSPGLLLLQRLQHDRLEVGRDPGRGGARPLRLRKANSVGNAKLVSRHVIRKFADEQLEENHAEGVDVRAGVDLRRVAQRLFGRHVRQAPHDAARAAQLRQLLAAINGEFGKAEIEQPGVASCVHHDVGRLQVPVDDAALVRRMDAFADLPKQLQNPFRCHLPVVDKTLQGLAVDQFHGVEQCPVIRLAGLVDRDNVGVAQKRDCGGFALETGP